MRDYNKILFLVLIITLLYVAFSPLSTPENNLTGKTVAAKQSAFIYGNPDFVWTCENLFEAAFSEPNGAPYIIDSNVKTLLITNSIDCENKEINRVAQNKELKHNINGQGN